MNKIKTYKTPFVCGVQDKEVPLYFNYNIKFTIRPMNTKERIIFNIKKFWKKIK